MDGLLAHHLISPRIGYPFGQKWTVPIGAGLSKTTRLGQEAVKLAFDAYYIRRVVVDGMTALHLRWTLPAPQETTRHSPSDGGTGESLIPVIAPSLITVHCAGAPLRKHSPLI
jgi:hypothetical protein